MPPFLSLLSPGWNWQKEAMRRSVRPGAPIMEPGESGWCHLVEQGLAATYVTVDRDRPTCVGLVGPGELIGLADLFGGTADPSRHVCAVVTSQTMRIPLAAMQAGLQVSPALRAICSRQLERRFTELRHIAACNARHVLTGRCAHWLLKLQARLGDTLPVTHEFLASILGVRRAGVTVTLQGLQRDGAIRQQRGSIAILDTERLRRTACSCPVTSPEPDDAHEPMRDAGSAADAACGEMRPRARLAAAIADTASGSPADTAVRIGAVLDVCRSVIATGQDTLWARPKG
jgi:CRP-like cAMP-binding protein